MRAGATGSTVYFSGGGLTGFALRQVERLGGLALLAAAAACVGALATWNVADPSFSHSTDNPVTNALGYGGAVYSDLAMQFFGLSALVTLVPLVAWGLLFATARGVDRMPKRGLAWFGMRSTPRAVAKRRPQATSGTSVTSAESPKNCMARSE